MNTVLTKYTIAACEFRWLLNQQCQLINRIQSLTDSIALPGFIIRAVSCFALNLVNNDDEWPHASWCYNSNTFSSSIAYSMSRMNKKKNKIKIACGYPNQELCKQVLTIEIICRLLFMPPQHNGLNICVCCVIFLLFSSHLAHFDRHFDEKKFTINSIYLKTNV